MIKKGCKRFNRSRYSIQRAFLWTSKCKLDKRIFRLLNPRFFLGKAFSSLYFFKFGNTCYVNSVLQALYFCRPFREKIIQYKIAYNQRTANLDSGGGGSGLTETQTSLNAVSNLAGSKATNNSSNSSLNAMNSAAATSTSNSNGSALSTATAPQVSILKQEHLLNCLAELFYSIVTMKKKKGIVQPKKFISRLRKDNGKEKHFLFFFLYFLKLRKVLETQNKRIWIHSLIKHISKKISKRHFMYRSFRPLKMWKSLYLSLKIHLLLFTLTDSHIAKINM